LTRVRDEVRVVDPTNLLGTAAKSFELVRKGLEAKGELDRVEDREAIVEAKEAWLDIKEDMLRLRAENIALKEKLSHADAYVLDQSVYWRKEDTERTQPFCPSCMSRHQVVPMTPNKQGTKVARFHCPSCKFGVDLNGYQVQINTPPYRAPKFTMDQRF
jgi:hypothetical protein